MAFPETCWSMLALATIHGDQAAGQALDELCRRYWQPVYAVIRSQGSGDDEARDRTQSFFLYLLENATLRKADRSRGRFRTFLLTVLWRFLRDERRRDNAEKRGGNLDELSLDELETELPSQPGLLNETLDREWALTTMERAIEVVRHEFVATRGEAAWSVWRGFLPGSAGVPSMSLAAKTLGVGEGGARSEVHRLRNRCREALRRDLIGTVSSPEDLDDEIAYLGRALQGAAADGHGRNPVVPMSKQSAER